MNKSIDFITRTKTKETTHKACVCVICDCFIIGIEPICWLTTEQLKTKESILSVEYYESSTLKNYQINCKINIDLAIQLIYQIYYYLHKLLK